MQLVQSHLGVAHVEALAAAALLQALLRGLRTPRLLWKRRGTSTVGEDAGADASGPSTGAGGWEDKAVLAVHGKARRSGAALDMCLLLSGALCFFQGRCARRCAAQGGTSKEEGVTRVSTTQFSHTRIHDNQILVTSKFPQKYNGTHGTA